MGGFAKHHGAARASEKQKKVSFRKALLFIACLLCVVPAVSSVVQLVASPGPLWLQVSYKTGFAPKKVTVDIHVVPIDTDRTIWLYVYEDGLEATSSEIPLEGAQSRRTHHWVWEAKWPGLYTVVAMVGNNIARRAAASERINIP